MEGTKKHYFGRYRAFVRDKNDPLKIGRVKLEIPEVFGRVISDWASPILDGPSSSNVGPFPKTQVGARVWAEFESGDENRPLWSGGWWPQGEVPKLATGDGVNDPVNAGKGTDKTKLPPKITDNSEIPEPANPYATKYGESFVIRTASGFVFEIDETPGEERLNVAHPSGTFFEVHKNGRLVVKTAGGRYTRVNGDDVRHLVGSRADHVEGDSCDYVQGSEARELDGKFQLLAAKGLVLEDGIGSTIVFDPTQGKITIQAVGNLDLVANGTINLDAANVSILGRPVLPIQGQPI